MRAGERARALERASEREREGQRQRQRKERWRERDLARDALQSQQRALSLLYADKCEGVIDGVTKCLGCMEAAMSSAQRRYGERDSLGEGGMVWQRGRQIAISRPSWLRVSQGEGDWRWCLWPDAFRFGPLFSSFAQCFASSCSFVPNAIFAFLSFSLGPKAFSPHIFSPPLRTWCVSCLSSPSHASLRLRVCSLVLIACGHTVAWIASAGFPCSPVNSNP